MHEKGDEATYQKKLAEHEQNIAAIEACTQEMKTYVEAISKSVSTLDSTRN